MTTKEYIKAMQAFSSEQLDNFENSKQNIQLARELVSDPENIGIVTNFMSMYFSSPSAKEVLERITFVNVSCFMAGVKYAETKMLEEMVKK